jgi:hypothetical protein
VSAAQADDARDRSRVQFRRGVELVQKGDYAAAKEAFDAAYQLFPHPSILLNIGVARLKTQDPVGAETALAKFLADDGGAPPQEIASARTALAEARERIGTLRLVLTPSSGMSVTLDGAPVAVVQGKPTELRVVRGKHALHLEAEGFEPADADLDVGEQETFERKLTAKRGVEAPKPQTPGIVWSPLGIGLSAGGVAAMGFGAFAGIRALSLADDYNTRGNAGYQDPGVRSEGTTFRTLADVGIGLGLVALAAGVYVLVMGPPGGAATASASPVK